jgi:flagellin-specific chaperone FliS
MEEMNEPNQEEVSKVELVRELIVGRDRKEIDAQISGMKDLFTSMLVENKKEYDKQVGDMKHLFVNILEENRTAFKQQLSEIQQALPQMIQSTVSKSTQEDFILVANESERKEQIRMSKIDAVKEIILGLDMQLMDEKAQKVNQQLDADYEGHINHLHQIGQEVSDELKASIDRLNDVLARLSEEIARALTKNDHHQAHRQVFSNYLEEMSKKMIV